MTTSTSAAGAGKNQKNNRHSLGGGVGLGSNGAPGEYEQAKRNSSSNHHHSDYLPKLDVIQDLDLYYIRQIACSLKVSILKNRVINQRWEVLIEW